TYGARVGVSGAQLCSLVGVAYNRFAMRRWRAHERVHTRSASRPDHLAADILPAKSLAGRVGYDAEDALMLGIAAEGERAGLSFSDAAKLATAAGAQAALHHDAVAGDLFAGCARLPGGRRLHATATWADWLAFFATEGQPDTCTV